jgi:thiol-disulfide isomerase/thioredoxin
VEAGAGAAKAAAEGVLPAGVSAKAFTLKDTRGKPVTFDPAKLEKPRLLVFWSVFCEPCKEELPMVGWVADKYAGEGFGVLAVNLDGESMATTAERFLKMGQLTFPTVMDRKEKKRFLTAEAYGVTGTPSLFLVGTDGTVRWSRVGRVEVSDLEAAVRASLGL